MYSVLHSHCSAGEILLLVIGGEVPGPLLELLQRGVPADHQGVASPRVVAGDLQVPSQVVVPFWCEQTLVLVLQTVRSFTITERRRPLLEIGTPTQRS